MSNRIVITQAKQLPLPTCNPNLMPFHIEHTGPAAVSTFLRIEKMRPEEEDMVEDKVAVKDDVEMKSDPLETSSSKIETFSVQASSSTSTLVASESLNSSISPSTSSSLPQMSSSVLKDIDKRFISSFRGRTIHGLTMDLPTGYSGLLLHHQDVDDDPQATADSEVKSGEDDEDVNSLDNDLDQGISLLKFIPQSTFFSITLWHADRAVDETRDEYYRTLTEWTALSHEIHRTDL